MGYARSTETHTTVEQSLRLAAEELVKHGSCDEAFCENWAEGYIPTSSIDDLASCSFVIESIIEDYETKNAVFDDIEGVVADDVPIASNTSAIPISKLQQQRKRPERFLGMHWAEPAYATRFLELIRGEQTGDEAFTRAIELANNCGKEPSFVNHDIPGFIANRLGYAMYREALHLLTTGAADAETIDRSFRNSIGLWATLCGPLRWIDLTGGPALYAQAMEPVLSDLCNDQAILPPLAELAKRGAQGIAGGYGFYEYTPVEAEKWEALLHSHAWEIKRLVDIERPLESSS